MTDSLHTQNDVRSDLRAASLRASPTASSAELHSAGPYPMGMMVLLATVTMLFTAFTAAILVRRTGTDWVQESLPWIVWANTVTILVSSIALEAARSSVRRGRSVRVSSRWLGGAGVLGILFLVGQVAGWKMFAAQGVFLSDSAYGAFFYMLSAAHGLHVAGGIGALIWTRRRTLAGAYSETQSVGLAHTAIYWHFVGVVWLYLLLLLSIF